MIKGMIYSMPEKQGVSSSKISAFLKKLYNLEYIHGTLIMRHGYVISESYKYPCSQTDRHSLFSLSKSFVSVAIGIASDMGLLTTDDFVLKFFKEYDSDKVRERMRRMKVSHLLSMCTGHSECFINRYVKYFHIRDIDSIRDCDEAKNWAKAFIEDDLPLEPGSTFVYNSGATFMLAEIILKVSGKDVCQFLKENLFDKLGYSDGINWERTFDGHPLGGWGLHLSLREIAAFGQMILNKGVFNGKRIVSEEYINEATSFKISNGDPSTGSDWNQGYGYQFWMCKNNCFRGDGYAGQLLFINSKEDIVIAITAGLSNMQRELDVIFEEFYGICNGEPVEQIESEYIELRNLEQNIKYDIQYNALLCHTGRTFTLDFLDNPLSLGRMILYIGNSGVSMSWQFTDGVEDKINAGYNQYIQSNLSFVSLGHCITACSMCHWEDEATLIVKMCLPTSPSYFTVKIKIGINVEEKSFVDISTPIWFFTDHLKDIHLDVKEI